MSYLNTTVYSAQDGSTTAGVTHTFKIPRYTPLDPSESPDSNGDYPSGVIDTSHAVKVGDIAYSGQTGSGSGGGLPETGVKIIGVKGGSSDSEYNNGAIINLTGDGSNFFSREVTVNGVRIVAAGSVGGQTAVPDAFVEKVARMFELFTDPNGAGINEASQRTFIKTLSGDAGTYHAAVGPTLQRVARGAGDDYTPNFLTDSGIAHYNLSPLFDSHVANDMVWYLNSTGDAPGDGDNDAQEVIEHVFHTLHMHGLDAVSLKMYPYITADWATGPLYAAMEEAYDAGKWDSSGYGGNAWKTDGDAFEVAAKEYLFLLNFGMFEYSSLWDGGSLAPEWTDDMRTPAGIQSNNPLGYALHNTYIAPVISKPSLTTIRTIFQDGDVGDPTIAGASGYIVDGGESITLQVENLEGNIKSLNAGDWITIDRVQNAIEGGKISFSKYPVQTITGQVPLFDIVSGEKLVDETGIELVTDAEISVREIANSENATGVVMPTGIGTTAIPVVEVFQETSETSTTLLGVERAEQQLSLFSDVSTLGLNEEEWEFYTLTGGTSLGAWDNRGTARFGNHYNASFIEQTEEQALELGAFPVPFRYPFGPRFANQGLYNEDLYTQFIAFVTLGNTLYTYFSTTERQATYGSTFKDNFLDPSKVTIDGSNDLSFNGVTEAQGYVLIDTWTRAWVEINDSNLTNPINEFEPFTPRVINAITNNSPLFSETRPGYASGDIRFSYLQSKKAYRYQPGRISGFTFGLRASSDSGSEQNVLEWGITNPTDQYVFQLKGATFNIVRRSTIPLPSSVMERQGLNPLTDQVLKASGDPNDIDPETGDAREYFTIEVPRDNWNIDQLNGNGPSGYLLTSKEVTMYKIEFSWYGAIGAKFYAYVPVSNGEARWVHVHTLVIENLMGQPCLEDPFFRFRYSLNIRDSARLKTPQYVYKYGASMYIDGGDEGTVTQHSYSSGLRTVVSTQDTTALGVYPKSLIVNKGGYEKENKKTIYPKSVNVSSDEYAQVKIIKCKACPGFGHNYNLGLKSGANGRTANFKFNTLTLNSITINPSITNYTLDLDLDDDGTNDATSQLFQLSDNGAKIIADGIYSTYIEVDEGSEVLDGSTIIGYTSANLKRIVQSAYTKSTVTNVSSSANPNSGFDDSGVVILKDGSSLTLTDYATDAGATYPHAMRISNYDGIAASTVALTGNIIDINFLNPYANDSSELDSAGDPVGGRHFAEFYVGVTDKEPQEDGGELKFEVAPGDLQPIVPDADVLFGEYTQSTTSRNRLGQDTGETNYPLERKMEIDYRIPQPPREILSYDSNGNPVYDPNDTTGDCSRVRITVQTKSELEGIVTDSNPQTGVNDGTIYLYLDSGFAFPNGTLTGGELGINNTGSGVTFTSEASSFQVVGATRQYAAISALPA